MLDCPTVSEATDNNVVANQHVQMTSDLCDALIQMIDSTDPVDNTMALDLLIANGHRIANLANELKVHRLTFKHVAMERSNSKPRWQQVVDEGHLIEGIKELRVAYEYDLLTAKHLAEAYRYRRYAWRQNA